MFDRLKPLQDRLLVKRIDNSTTEGGIIIPTAAQEQSCIGTILASGPGKRNGDSEFIPMEAKVGDTVYFGKYAGIPLDEFHLILREDELLGLL